MYLAKWLIFLSQVLFEKLMNWYRFGHYLVDYGSYTFISKLMTWILITYISWGSVTDSNYLASTFIFFVRKLIGLIWKTWIWHDWTTLKTAKMSAVSIWKKLNSDFFHVTDFLPPCNISKIIVRPVFISFIFYCSVFHLYLIELFYI